MSLDPDRPPPYFDSRLDRWKLAVLLLLFLILLVLALLWPEDAPLLLQWTPLA